MSTFIIAFIIFALTGLSIRYYISKQYSSQSIDNISRL